MAWPWQLCLVLMVSLFLPLLVTHTCTGADTDTMETTQTPSMPPIVVTPKPNQKPIIRVGITIPDSMLRKRMFQNQIRAAIRPFNVLYNNMLGDKYELSYQSFIQTMIPPKGTPGGLSSVMCDTFLPANISAIIYLTGHTTTACSRFVQLAENLGIPVINWNADNSGRRKASTHALHLQMLPSIHHQAAAMLSILVQYGWYAFTIVTSTTPGHTGFVQTIMDQVLQYGDIEDTSKPNINFTIIDSVVVNNAEEDLQKIKGSEARIFLLYSTQDEAETIMRKAEEMQLTGKNFVWIVTESVIGSNPNNAAKSFPVGMLGVHFDTNEEGYRRGMVSAIRVFVYGVQKFLEDPSNAQVSLQTTELSCEEGNYTGEPWTVGPQFYSVLKNLSIPYNQVYQDAEEAGRLKNLEFLSDGTRKDVELKIMNLRKSKTTLANAWEEIGTWSSLHPDKMNINGIVWPEEEDTPPSGVPEEDQSKKDNEEEMSMSAITARIVFQQCLNASLTIPGDVEPEVIDIGKGMVVSIGFFKKASEETVNKLVQHISNVRLSGDGTGKRCSILDVQGDILIVPQPTLGGRLSDNLMKYDHNIESTLGEELYDRLCQDVRTVVEENSSGNVTCGVYGARQVLKMETNGPFTHIIHV